MKTKHGGKRVGAGRRRVMSLEQRLELGGACEKLWRDRAERRARAAHESRQGLSEVRKLQAELHAMPVKERKHGRFLRERLGDVAQGLKEAVGRRRFVALKLVRPYGERERIVRAVAWCASRRGGQTITEATLNECWREFRKIATRLKREARPRGRVRS